MQELSSIGRYRPMANGSTGMPRSSTASAINTPIKTSVHGRLPPITPSTIIFMSVACGAESSGVPKPQAAFNRYNTKPIVTADTTVPIISPYCCFTGVAPKM